MFFMTQMARPTARAWPDEASAPCYVDGDSTNSENERHVMFVPPPDPQLKCRLAPPPCTSYGAAARAPRPALILILIVRLTLILIVCLAR